MVGTKSPYATSASGSAARYRQTARIRELGSALVASGLHTLDEQAKALGLSRSTAWTVLKGKHKATGLNAATIRRMLSSPELPLHVRETLLTYVEEKTAGYYGHNKKQLRRFAASFYPSGYDWNEHLQELGSNFTVRGRGHLFLRRRVQRQGDAGV